MFKKFFYGIAVAILVSCNSEGQNNEVLVNGSLLVLNKMENSGILFNLETGEREIIIETGNEPHEGATTEDGKFSIISNMKGSGVTVLNLETNSTRYVQYREGGVLHGIDFEPDSHHYWITAEGFQEVWKVDLDTDSILAKVSTSQEGSHMINLLPSRNLAFITNLRNASLSVIDMENQKLLKTIPCKEGAEGMDISPDGSEVWVSNRAANSISIIDTEQLNVIKTIEKVGNVPIRVKFLPDGKRVVVSSVLSHSLLVFSMDSREQIKEVSLKTWKSRKPGPVGILPHPDEPYVFVACTKSDEILIINTDSWGDRWDP